MNDYPAEVLAEHFSKPDTLKDLFDLAKYFEMIAFKNELPDPRMLTISAKALIGILCDFHSIDRKKFL